MSKVSTDPTVMIHDGIQEYSPKQKTRELDMVHQKTI